MWWFVLLQQQYNNNSTYIQWKKISCFFLIIMQVYVRNKIGQCPNTNCPCHPGLWGGGVKVGTWFTDSFSGGLTIYKAYNTLATCTCFCVYLNELLHVCRSCSRLRYMCTWSMSRLHAAVARSFMLHTQAICMSCMG